jgi:hypothetical protein
LPIFSLIPQGHVIDSAGGIPQGIPQGHVIDPAGALTGGGHKSKILMREQSDRAKAG